MAVPSCKLRSKLNRAIAQYLINQNAGATDDTFPANTKKDQPYQRTVIHSTIGTPDPPLTGNYRVRVHVRIQGSARRKTADDATPDGSRVDFDNRVGAVNDALMQSDDDQTLRATAQAISDAGRAMAMAVDGSDAAIQFAQDNVDMADFTVVGWYDAGFGDGVPEESGCEWEEVLLFDALCCNANVD